jgi:Outer membrane protein beta-barrel domain
MNLKRTIIVCMSCLLLVAWAKQANAQDQRFRFGLKLSGNLSWIAPATKNIESSGNGFGISYGVMGDYNFQKFYALSTELIFTNISGGIKHTDLLQYTPDSGGTMSYQDINYDYNFKYLQLPVSIKFKTKEMGYITYWAQFGLAPSFLIEAKADITGRTPFDDPSEIRVNKSINDVYHFDDFDDKIFFFRMPLIIGGGIEYSLAGNTSLYTGIRMDSNFLTIFNSDDRTSAKNHYVGLNLGVFF